MAEVNVTYDFVNRTIAVDVLVPAEGSIVAALPVIPHGDGWVVTWNLKGEGEDAPRFDAGILLGAKPSGLTTPSLLSPHNSIGGTSWTIMFDNQCTSDGQVQYFISGTRGDADHEAFKREDFLHDPTIAVVTDPPN